MKSKAKKESSKSLEKKSSKNLANSPSKRDGRGKSKKKKKGETKKIEVITPPKVTKFDLDFIYRRERYTLKNLMLNFLVSGIKKLISKKISVELKDLRFYYQDKELKEDNDKINVYEMIKDNAIQFFEVKKESANHENIVSLNSKYNLVYKVKCSSITNYIDFVEKIEKFFRDLCLERHYLCEPSSMNEYIVNFSCEDHCFQFKRYMMNVQRTDPLYEKSLFIHEKVDKSKIVAPKGGETEEEAKYSKSKGINSSPTGYINTGPYVTLDEVKKKEEKEEKKKWLNKKGFAV